MLSTKNLETVIHSFITFCLDSCDSTVFLFQTSPNFNYSSKCCSEVPHKIQQKSSHYISILVSAFRIDLKKFRSSGRGLLVIHRSRQNTRDCGTSCQRRSGRLARSVSSFKSLLKTYVFRTCFPLESVFLLFLHSLLRHV